MKKIDVRINQQTMDILKTLIGKRLQSYEHDEFKYTNSSSQVVRITMENDVPYYFYSFVESLDYFGTQEDVSVISFSDTELPLVEKKNFIKMPVGEVVKSIYVINENQRVFEEDEQTYDVWLTRGIIFEFENHQVAFEKDMWFSEEIIVHKGYDLINEFSPIDEFGKEWDTSVKTECSREVIDIKGEPQ